MTDAEWLEHIKSFKTCEEVLKEMVDKISNGYFGHDPYYADLKWALVAKAEELLTNEIKE